MIQCSVKKTILFLLSPLSISIDDNTFSHSYSAFFFTCSKFQSGISVFRFFSAPARLVCDIPTLIKTISSLETPKLTKAFIEFPFAEFFPVVIFPFSTTPKVLNGFENSA
jgi:hypothetical protein